MGAAIDRSRRYSRVAIAFHWSIAALVVTNLAIGLFSDSLFDGVPNLMSVHKSIGVTVLVLSLARFGWRLTHVWPPLPDTIPMWQQVAARLNHAAFYALMIAMPLTGWLMVSGAETRRPLTWFGLFDVPYLPVGTAAGEIGHDLHGVLGLIFAGLIVLHVAAALRHHFVLRDATLARMLPGAGR